MQLKRNQASKPMVPSFILTRPKTIRKIVVENGASRPMKMGTTASPSRYDWALRSTRAPPGVRLTARTKTSSESSTRERPEIPSSAHWPIGELSFNA